MYIGWTMDVSPVTVAPFTGETGPAVSISSDPRELFSLFLDDTVVDLIVTETNRYAEQCLAESARVWSTNAEEIRAYIGFNILMVSAACRRSEITGLKTRSCTTLR